MTTTTDPKVFDEFENIFKKEQNETVSLDFEGTGGSMLLRNIGEEDHQRRFSCDHDHQGSKNGICDSTKRQMKYTKSHHRTKEEIFT